MGKIKYERVPFGCIGYNSEADVIRITRVNVGWMIYINSTFAGVSTGSIESAKRMVRNRLAQNRSTT